jgi:hypothetical protein
MLYLSKAKGLIAIKEYPCAFCGGVISRYESYHCIYYKNETEQKNGKMHANCSDKFCRENFLTEYKKNGKLHHEDCSECLMGYSCDCPN